MKCVVEYGLRPKKYKLARTYPTDPDFQGAICVHLLLVDLDAIKATL